MLAIARALMSRPKLLLLDEPSLGLAPLIVKQIFQVIADLNKREGLTVFLVEQNAFHALRLAHRAYVMVNGAITLVGHGPRAAREPGGARRLPRRRPALGGFAHAVPVDLRRAATRASGSTCSDRGAGRRRGARHRRRRSPRPGARPGRSSAPSFCSPARCASSITRCLPSRSCRCAASCSTMASCCLFAASGFQLTRARQMVEQYPWAYEPAGLLSWRRKGELDRARARG